jgi:hypothetical protein
MRLGWESDESVDGGRRHHLHAKPIDSSIFPSPFVQL